MKASLHASGVLVDEVGSCADINRATAQRLDVLQGLREGTILLKFATLVDGTLLSARAADESAEWELAIERNRLVRRVTVDGGISSFLDAEDADRLNDGRDHDVAVVVGPRGTSIFLDGYELFTATDVSFFEALGELGALEVGREAVPEVSHLTIRSDVLTPRGVLAHTEETRPLVEFAAERLADRDARRCAELSVGSLRARFRVRGRHQGGVILQGGLAKQDPGQHAVTLRIDSGDLRYSVTAGGRTLVDVVAPGNWDDGGWHDIVVTSGYGATIIYVDGFQVGRAPGVAFFRDVADVDVVTVGMDIDGSRLFGEASTAMVFDQILSDAQVKRLSMVDPLDTNALFDTGMLGSVSYRIPSLLRTQSGVLIAGADQRTAIANDSPNHINFVIRRSLDDGATWEDLQTVISSPGEGPKGASVIDSLLVEDRSTGRIVVLIDHFPGGVGQPNSALGTGFNDAGRLLLTDDDGDEHELQEDGQVLRGDGTPTEYRVETDGTVLLSGEKQGNIWDSTSHPPLRPLLSCYLWMVTSDDDGETWSDPVDITPQVKQPWMRFLGTSPGSGIQIEKGPYAGRLVMPVYYNREENITFSAAVVYSDDGGTTWCLGGSPNDEREIDGQTVHSRTLSYDAASLHESTVFEAENGELVLLMRNQNSSGRVARSRSSDGGQTWGPVDFDPQLTEIFSQPNAVALSTERGRGVVFANASQLLPFRGCGVLRLSYDDGRTWPHNRVFNPRHYVYQSMAQLSDGSIGLLWEREWHGIYFTRIPLSWLEESRQSLTSL